MSKKFCEYGPTKPSKEIIEIFSRKDLKVTEFDKIRLNAVQNGFVYQENNPEKEEEENPEKVK